MDEYEMQKVELTRAAALEATARALMDFDDWTKEAVVEIARKVVVGLGFK